MREILFRGKTNDGEWVYGSLHIELGETDKNRNQNLDYRILGLRGECDYVIPETVGQYTGLTDKNGTKIFEGDIVNIDYGKTTVKNTVIKYIGASFYGDRFDDCWELDGYYQLEVIGNMHDNPEIIT